MSDMQRIMRNILSGSSGETAALLETALNGLPSGLLLMDEGGRLCYANPAAYRIFFAENDTELEEQAAAWLRMDDPALIEDQGFLRLRHEGRLYLYTRHMHVLTENGQRRGILHVIQKAKQSSRELLASHFLTTHDSLTAVYNRSTFYAQCRHCLTAHPGTDYLLLRGNIRDFQLVNSLFGEEQGNEVLLKIADYLLAYCTEDMVYGRLENEHFAVLMPESLLDLSSLRRVCAALSDMIHSAHYVLHFQIGIFRIQDPDINISIMCDRAKMALRTITGDELCAVSWYSDVLLEQTKHEREIISDFDRSLMDGLIQPYLQAQVDKDGRLLGAEVLSRWIDRNGAVVEPGSFVSILENAGLVYKLDRYIWEEAARILARWKHFGYENITLSVNISLQDVYYLDIESYFVELVRRYDLRPEQLNLEFTESAIMSNVAGYSHLVGRMHKHGFRIEIDDFGSGYSSLNMLKDIPADFLKIDMLFLADTQQTERSMVILDSILSMASRLRMPVITEGVRSQEQVDFLSARGCQCFQGYYFSKPSALAAFEKRYNICQKASL